MKAYQELSVNFFVDNLSETEIKLERLLKKVSDLISDNNFNELDEIYHYIKNVKYSGQGYLESLEDWNEEMSRILDVGYVYALIDFVQRYTEKLKTEQEILKVKTKYRDSVLSILAKRRNIFHKDLAAALRVSASGLNAVIKQMNATSVKLVNIEEISKFKLYSLTPAAYKYVSRNNINDIYGERTQQNKDIDITYGRLEFKTNKSVKRIAGYSAADNFKYIYKKTATESLFEDYNEETIRINNVNQTFDNYAINEKSKYLQV